MYADERGFSSTQSCQDAETKRKLRTTQTTRTLHPLRLDRGESDATLAHRMGEGLGVTAPGELSNSKSSLAKRACCGNCITTKNESMFGTFIKELRARQRLGLREFCLEHGHDPSNWSKIEREILQPPRDEETLRTWAKQLGLKPNSDDWLKFFEYAAVDAGRIPDQILEDEKLAAHLPVFFRTLSGQKPSREDLEKLVELIKSANRP